MQGRVDVRAMGAKIMDESASRGIKQSVTIGSGKHGQLHQIQKRRPLRLRIDLERLVSDAAYREDIRRRLQEYQI